jgi:hypothetical protein
MTTGDRRVACPVNDRGRMAGAATPPDGEIRRRAARTCARYATDAEDLALLLDMLGLATTRRSRTA